MTRQEYSKKWRAKNKVYMSEYAKKYYLENKEVIKTRAKNRYIKNADEIKQYAQDYYQKNKERHRENHKAWKLVNPDRYRRIHSDVQQRRRARLKSIVSDKYSREEIYNKFGGYCIVCDKEIDLTIKYPSRLSFSIHHLMPLSQGGTNTQDNVAPAHLICNIKVGSKIPIAIKPRVYNV